jgi:hypothetical protein
MGNEAMYNRSITKSNYFQEGAVDQNNTMRNIILTSDQRDNL